jgi:hypothetical protein
MSGGQERDLKRLAGWSSDVMLERYGASAADARAKAAAERDARLNVVRTGEPVAQGGAAAQLATEEAARKAAADLAAQQKAAQDAAARDLGM